MYLRASVLDLNAWWQVQDRQYFRTSLDMIKSQVKCQVYNWSVKVISKHHFVYALENVDTFKGHFKTFLFRLAFS